MNGCSVLCAALRRQISIANDRSKYLHATRRHGADREIQCGSRFRAARAEIQSAALVRVFIPAGDLPPVLVASSAGRGYGDGKNTGVGQLRSSGIHPAACAGELVAFGQDAHRWSPALIELAANMAERLEADWRAFRDKPPSG